MSVFNNVLFYFLSDYPWRTAVEPLTSNVIKWFYLPDFAMRPNPLFIFCEFSSFPLSFSFLLVYPHYNKLIFLCNPSPALCRWPPPVAVLLSAVAGVWGGEPSSGAAAGWRQRWNQPKSGSLYLQPVHTSWQLPSLQVSSRTLFLCVYIFHGCDCRLIHTVHHSTFSHFLNMKFKLHTENLHFCMLHASLG